MILKPDRTIDQLLVLLLKRKTSEKDPWSGHMAFPAGRKKETDSNLRETANREVLEESGIDSKKCELLGTLEELLPGNRSLLVTPLVLLAPEATDVTIDDREIADHVWIPLNFFMDQRNSSPYHDRGSGREGPSFVYLGNYIVWGMTLRIIHDFLSKID